MRTTFLTLTAAIVLVAGLNSSTAEAGWRDRADRVAAWHAAQMPWHGPYYYTAWGYPASLVVPPTANMQSSYSWGVAQTEMRPIYHQFERPFPGYAPGGSFYPLLPTPAWPSHTDQFGVYYNRGPW